MAKKWGMVSRVEFEELQTEMQNLEQSLKRHINKGHEDVLVASLQDIAKAIREKTITPEQLAQLEAIGKRMDANDAAIAAALKK